MLGAAEGEEEVCDEEGCIEQEAQQHSVATQFHGVDQMTLIG